MILYQFERHLATFGQFERLFKIEDGVSAQVSATLAHVDTPRGFSLAINRECNRTVTRRRFDLSSNSLSSSTSAD